MESTLSSRSELHGTAISKRTIQACDAIGNPCDKWAKPETLSVFEHGLLNQHSFSRRPWFKSQPSQTETVTSPRHNLLQPLRWCCVDCVIHHKWDVREEQHHMYMWHEKAITEWSRRAISIVAYCHGAKLCAHAPRDFRSQHCMRSSIVHATPLCWRQYHPTCLQHRDLHMCGWFRTSLGQPSLIHFCIL